jgi:hypothetical protein
MPKNYRIKNNAWGEPKKNIVALLTPTAIDLADNVADELKLTRSELLERLVRYACDKKDLQQALLEVSNG